MKKWCKIIRLKSYDVLVQRLVTKEDGEHVKITVRVPDGQFVKTASFGDEVGISDLEADGVYDTYTKKQALLFITELEKLMIGDEKEDDNTED